MCNFSENDLKILAGMTSMISPSMSKELSDKRSNVDVLDVEPRDDEVYKPAPAIRFPDVVQGKFSLFHPWNAYADPEGEYQAVLGRYVERRDDEKESECEARQSYSTSSSLSPGVVFDGVSLVQEVNHEGLFSVFSCGKLVEKIVEAVSACSTTTDVMQHLLKWRSDWRGYCGLVRCRTKEHLNDVFSPTAQGQGRQHDKSRSPRPSSMTNYTTLYRIFDSLHRLITLETFNFSPVNPLSSPAEIALQSSSTSSLYLESRRNFLLTELFALEEKTPFFDEELAMQQFQSIMNGSKGFPDLIEKLKQQLKKNGATGLLSTKAFVAAIRNFVQEAKRRNFTNRVQIYEKVEQLLMELYETERKSSFEKLKEYLRERNERKEKEEKDLKKSYNYSWDSALRGNSWVFDGFSEEKGSKAAGGASASSGGSSASSSSIDDVLIIDAEDLPNHFNNDIQTGTSESYFKLTWSSPKEQNKTWEQINKSLDKNHFAIIDNFMTLPTATKIKQEVFDLNFTPSEIWVGRDGGIGAHVHKLCNTNFLFMYKMHDKFR